VAQKHDTGYKKRQWAERYGLKPMSRVDRLQKRARERGKVDLDYDAIAQDIESGVLPGDDRSAQRR
jgi:hypothetical protein